MQLLRVENQVINLGQVTSISFEDDRVVFYFPITFSDDSEGELEFYGETAKKLRAYFAHHWPFSSIGTFNFDL